MSRERLFRMMAGDDHTLAGALARAGLSLVEPGYRAAVGLRNAIFNAGLRRPRRLGPPVISVGNITTGGTGKTPMVIELARRLGAVGASAGVLLRGYRLKSGSRATFSDEAGLLAGELGSSMVVANPNRAEGARQVLEACSHVNVLLLDDGFQHRQVYRDLDLVLIDATAPFGFGHVLPRGLLREPLKNLRRADAVIVTRVEQVDADRLGTIDRHIECLIGRPPIAHAAYCWKGWRDENGKSYDLKRLSGELVLGTCGIGNPGAFSETLRRTTCRDSTVLPFGDHYVYARCDVEKIFTEAQRRRASALVTTDKDWVKWQPLLTSAPPFPVFRPILQIEFVDGAEAVDVMLAIASPVGS